MPQTFHTRYAPNPKPKHFKPVGVSRTKQQFKEEVDINNIVKKYIASNYDVNLINKKKGFYADFSQDIDLGKAYDTIDRANDEFMQLPAVVREEFGNDPELFFRAVNSEEGIQKHADLFIASGIMNKADKVTSAEPSPTPSGGEGERPPTPPAEPPA